ncbi:hypothetical protein LZ575_09435 [Antarcticibacterium sp. 1MA-6-2]|uniref:hypothetical protein n=1 Tax=Antarcticibacterium sp. 1MA-6-2 TaxID=2908210 RepID=UPI001F3F993D|nr:hypothetical protein [Antarcticibacterium sp. 1MA-6-2]UJH92662.1 hypothetical protein LZ575_09435 [Antarcticibacterium sp. 1MA-6-2]
MNFLNYAKTLFAILCFLLTSSFALAQHIYVSVNGSDMGKGSKNDPILSIQKALEKANKLKKDSGKVKVFFREGSYTFEKTVFLDNSFSNIDLQAYPGEEVIFNGGVSIPIERIEKNILPSDSYHPEREVHKVNLKKTGITNYGELRNVGFSRPYGPAWGELFVNKKAMHLARWPNKGMVPTGKVLDKGSVPREDDFSDRGGIIQYDSLRINNWAKEKNIWMSGYFMHGYADDMVKIKKLTL